MTAWLTAGLVFVVIFLTMLGLYGRTKKRAGRNEERSERLADDLERLDRAHLRLLRDTPRGAALYRRWLRRVSEHENGSVSDPSVPDNDLGNGD